MKKPRITALLISFTLLSLISILTLYYTQSLPTEKIQVTTLWTYGHYGIYDYVAALKENTVYYNKSTLRPGEGPLYLAITDQVAITFNYTFQSSLPANVTIQYYIDETLKTPKWQRLLHRTNHTTTEQNEITSLDIPINSIPLISLSQVDGLVAKISQETGAYVSSYNVTVTTGLYVEARTLEGQINEAFTPTIAAIFNRGTAEGSVLLIENLYQSKTGSATQTDIIPQDWVINQQYFSYALSVVSFAGLVFAASWFVKTGPATPTKPEALIEEVIEPFKEIIIEIAKEPQTSEEQLSSITTIPVKTLEDLVKVADALDKPILHVHKSPETHIFYVIDETTRYEHTILESDIIKMTREEEEED